MGDPSPGTRTLFLHVFEITDETNLAPTKLSLSGLAGVDIGAQWRVRFNATGPLGGTVDDRNLATVINVEAQYAGKTRSNW